MRFSLILALFIGIVFLNSCKKCQVCKVTGQSNEVIYDYPEECGRSKALEEYAKQCVNEYDRWDGYTCSCSDVE